VDEALGVDQRFSNDRVRGGQGFTVGRVRDGQAGPDRAQECLMTMTATYDKRSAWEPHHGRHYNLPTDFSLSFPCCS
jgi:hypothetical protein